MEHQRFVNERLRNCPLVCIGLGGICEGYLKHVLDFHHLGIVPFSLILLTDGKAFREGNRERQYFQGIRGKAVDRCETWRQLFPDAPLRHRNVYVDRDNVAHIVTSGSIVFLSPDNHATRKLVSDHAETLDDILLITGTNDAIDPRRGLEGVEGQVIVHWKVQGRNLTPPITKYHAEIAQPEDQLPSELSCGELAQSYPQLHATNILVGHGMAQILLRYVTLPPEEAVQVVEFGVNSREGSMVPYGVEVRSP